MPNIIGQINRFPILVVDEEANSSRQGIASQLRTDVRPLTAASSEDIVAVSTVRESLSGYSLTTSGANITDGTPVFEPLSSEWSIPITGAMIFFHTLSGAGTIAVEGEEDGAPYVYSTAVKAIQDFEVFYWQQYMNGGTLQTCTTINASDLGGNGIPLLLRPFDEYAIGKILIKCSEAFDSEDLRVSIGFDSDKDYFAEEFTPPTETSDSINRLVPFTYGAGLEDRVEYINVLHPEASYGNEYPSLYTLSGSATSGTMQVIIFYDNNNDLNTGYFLTDTPIQALRFNTSTIYSLAAGLPSNVFGGAGVSSQYAGYSLFGQTASTSAIVNTVDKIAFDNETTTTPSITLGTYKKGYTNNGMYDDIQGLAPGGQTNGSVYLSSLVGVTFATDTAYAAAQTVSENKDTVSCLNNEKISFMVGGYTGAANSTIIQRYSFIDDTVSYVAHDVITFPAEVPTNLSHSTGGFITNGCTTGLNSLYMLEYDTTVFANIGSNLATYRTGAGGVYDDTYGFIAGGSDSSTNLTSIDQLRFYDKTLITPNISLGIAEHSFACTQS